MVFGLLHACGVWAGDILFVYGVCSLWVFWLKRRSPKALIIVGTIVLLISPALLISGGLSVSYWPPEAVDGMMVGWQPSPDLVAQEVANFQGYWSDQARSRVPFAIGLHTGAFIFWAFWRVSGLMIIGMALFKIGFFSAKLSDRVYKRCVGISFLGVPILVVFGIWAFQIPLSAFWLKRFRFGPFEWLWRTLAYMKLQPMMR